MTFDLKDIEAVVKESLDSVLKGAGHSLEAEKPKPSFISKIKTVIKEALVLTPRSFLNKTEKLSERTKETHEIIYKSHITNFNKVSIRLDSALRDDANSDSCDLRSLKMDEQYNLNAVKLHELYFGNVGDLASEITYETIPYIKITQSFGNFEKWQYDFIACCMSAREGWAVTYYEPFRGVYMNAIVDGNSVGIPLGGIPIIVMDMWSHSYFKEYANDKKAYIVSMMRELNWNVIEARMVVSERSESNKLFQIMPLVNNQPEVMLQQAAANALPLPVQPTSIPAPVSRPALGPGFAGGPNGDNKV